MSFHSASELHADTCVPSTVSLNINSLSLTNPGGIADRFFKVLCLTLHLTQRFEVVCLQDTRHPSDNFCKGALTPLFPGYAIHASASDKESGGIVTIISPSALRRFTATQSKISDGAILRSTLRRKEDGSHVTHVHNCYLDASRTTDCWTKQMHTLISSASNERSIYLGDFNHVTCAADRTGTHRDRSATQAGLFKKWLDQSGLQEIYQPLHTFYRCGNSGIVCVIHMCVQQALHAASRRCLICSP